VYENRSRRFFPYHLGIHRLGRLRLMGKQVSSVDTLSALNQYLPLVKCEINRIISNICGKHDMPENIAARITGYYTHCVDYNLVGGKLARARTVSETLYMCLPPGIAATEDQKEAALVLGYVVHLTC
jgi:hypothetical protein